MTPKTINADLSVSPQIEPGDIAQIKALGFKSIICNRPDGESPDQADFASIQAEADAAGLEFRFLPIISGQMQQANVSDFAQALEDLPKPVFAYCRTGTRCATVWALSQAGSRPVDEILRSAAEAGYDLRPVFGIAG